MERNEQTRGFTLVEMLVAIAVVAVLASIAIPPLIQARKAGAESAAQQVLRSLRTAEVHHKSKYGCYGNLNSLLAMTESVAGEGGTDPASQYTLTSCAADETYTIVALPPKGDMSTYTLVDSGDILGQ